MPDRVLYNSLTDEYLSISKSDISAEWVGDIEFIDSNYVMSSAFVSIVCDILSGHNTQVMYILPMYRKVVGAINDIGVEHIWVMYVNRVDNNLSIDTEGIEDLVDGSLCDIL